MKFASLFVLVLSAISIRANATEACGHPVGAASGLFKIIMDPNKGTGEVDSYLAQNIVALDSKNELCETPLMSAIRARKMDLYLYFYKKAGSPNVNSQDNQHLFSSESLYRYSLKKGNLQIINLVKQQGGTLENTGFSPLMYAAAGNTVDVVKAVLASDPKSVNQISTPGRFSGVGQSFDNDGCTPLIFAAQFNSPEVVSALLQAGAQINLNDDYYGRGTALNYAIYRNSRAGNQIAQILISSGADVNLGRDITPLQIAAARNSWPMMQALLRAGSKINPAKSQSSALNYVSQREDMTDEMILGLLNAGADPNAGICNIYACSIPIKSLAGNKRSTFRQFKSLICAGAKDYGVNGEYSWAFQQAQATGLSQDIVDLLKKLATEGIPQSSCESTR